MGVEPLFPFFGVGNSCNHQICGNRKKKGLLLDVKWWMMMVRLYMEMKPTVPFFEHQSDHVSIETHGDLGMPHDLNKTQRLAGKPLNTNWPCWGILDSSTAPSFACTEWASTKTRSSCVWSWGWLPTRRDIWSWLACLLLMNTNPSGVIKGGQIYYKWRFIARKIIYKRAIFHCHVDYRRVIPSP